MSLNYKDSLDKLLVGMKEKYKAWNTSLSYKSTGMDILVKSGRKFDKVISDNSVWGFVAKKDGLHKGLPFKEGDVFKPAGWAAAAKHVRVSIYDTNSDWYAWTGPNYLV